MFGAIPQWKCMVDICFLGERGSKDAGPTQWLQSSSFIISQSSGSDCGSSYSQASSSKKEHFSQNSGRLDCYQKLTVGNTDHRFNSPVVILRWFFLFLLVEE